MCCGWKYSWFGVRNKRAFLDPRESEMYKLYDEYLGRDFSSDYWSDEGISQAGLMLSRFTDSDWSALATSCLGKPEKWGIRCAETLGDIQSYNAILVLLQLLKSVNYDIRVAVLDSIRSHLSSTAYISPHVQEITDAVTQIRASKGVDHIVDLILTSLEKQMVRLQMG